MHFSPACHLFSGVIRNHFWSSKCHLKGDTPSWPTAQCPQTPLAPSAERLSSVHKLDSLSVPKPFPSLASARFSVAGAGDLRDVGIREGHTCKGECNRDQGEEEEEKEEGKGLLPGTAMACETLIWSSGHQVWATLTRILTVFLRYITFRNVFCALLSKNDRQTYNICFFFFHLHFRGFVRGLTN